MSELQFPKDPIVGQQYDFPPYKYHWDGIKWKTMGIGYNPVNDLRDELEPRIETSEKNIEDLSAQSFEALRRSYADAGLNLVDGSFEEGGTLTDASDVLLHKTSGIAYSGPIGQVAAGTDPTAVGSGYVPRADVTLRVELSNYDGDSLIGYATYQQIRDYSGPLKSIRCGGRSSIYSGDGAHGKFYRDDSDTTSTDNDGTILVDSVGRRWKRKYNGLVKATWFGVSASGLSSDAAANTSAMNNAHSLGKIVEYPAGNIYLQKVTIPAGGIVGQASGVVDNALGATIFHTTDTSSDNIITFTGDVLTSSAPTFKNFALLSASVAKSGGYGIALRPSTPASARCDQAVFDNIHMRYLPGCIDTSDSADFKISKCNFYFYSDKAVKVANQYAADVGDSSISESTFFNGNGGTYGSLGYGIWQESSGGLRVTNNKFNGGVSAYMLDLKATTSDFIFTGNSVENTSGVALNFNNSANTADTPVRFQNVVIQANQFARNQIDISFNLIANYSGSSYWDDINISGNAFFFITANQNSLTLRSARRFLVSDNVYDGNSVGYRAIFVDSSCPSGRIGINARYSLANGYLLNSASGVLVDLDSLHGSVSGISITSVYGSGANLYANTGTVSFSTQFESAPLVFAQVKTSGTILTITVFNVTATGFSYQIIANGNATTGAFDWKADGLLRSY